MTSVTTHDGLRLHVVVHGPDLEAMEQPLTVVLAHCWTADLEDWHYQVRDLLSHFGHRVRILTWDHRGHGKSDPSPRAHCTIDHLARDMGAVIDAHAPTGPLVIAGHSLGGMTMMGLAQHRPDIVGRARGAMFVATSSGELSGVTLGLPEAGALVKAQIPRMLAARARLVSRPHRRRTPTIERHVVQRFLFGHPLRARDAGLVVDQLISCPPATMRGFYEDCMGHDRAADLRAYDGIPTRVLVGDRDLLTPLAHARRIAAHVAGARLLVAPGAGHMLPLERDALVSAELVELVEGALARPAPM